MTITAVVQNEPLQVVVEQAGAQGLSAYQVAVKNGFEGTEQEWLDSLQGSGGGGGGGGSQGLYVQDTQPDVPAGTPYLWVKTDTTPYTLWLEDGA